MGILDDLAMGLGMKERTADYDARTARTIAARDAYNAAGGSEAQRGHAAAMARKNFSYDNAGGNARIFLDRTGAKGGYEAGAYRPALAQDDRPFMQRMLTSPQGAPSPNPYAIGPVSMDKPLPQFGLLGLFTGGMSNLFSRDRDPSAAISVGERAMGMLPSAPTQTTPIGTTPTGTTTAVTTPVVTNLQPEDTLEELTSPLSDAPLQPVLGAPTVKGSGKYPQYLYDRGYSDLFLDSLPKADLDFLLSFDPTIP